MLLFARCACAHETHDEVFLAVLYNNACSGIRRHTPHGRPHIPMYGAGLGRCISTVSCGGARRHQLLLSHFRISSSQSQYRFPGACVFASLRRHRCPGSGVARAAASRARRVATHARPRPVVRGSARVASAVRAAGPRVRAVPVRASGRAQTRSAPRHWSLEILAAAGVQKLVPMRGVRGLAHLPRNASRTPNPVNPCASRGASLKITLAWLDEAG